MADSTNPWRKSSFEDRWANEICTCKLAPLSTWRVCSLPEPNTRYGRCLIRLESGDLIIFIERGCSHETYCYPLQVGCFVYLEFSDACPVNSRWDLVALYHRSNIVGFSLIRSDLGGDCRRFTWATHRTNSLVFVACTSCVVHFVACDSITAAHRHLVTALWHLTYESYLTWDTFDPRVDNILTQSKSQITC